MLGHRHQALQRCVKVGRWEGNTGKVHVRGLMILLSESGVLS